MIGPTSSTVIGWLCTDAARLVTGNIVRLRWLRTRNAGTWPVDRMAPSNTPPTRPTGCGTGGVWEWKQPMISKPRDSASRIVAICSRLSRRYVRGLSSALPSR